MNMQHKNLRLQDQYREDDEIDLLELSASLWRGKWIIGGVMLLTLIPTFIWLKFQPDIYKVEALLDSTSQYDIQSLQPSILEEGGNYQVQPLTPTQVYNSLITQAGSLNTQRIFWEEWSKQPLSSDPRTGTTDNDSAFRVFVEGFSITPPDSKTPEIKLSKLAIEAEDPTAGTSMLTQYVDFLNRKVVEQYASQISMGLKTNLDQLKMDYATLSDRETRKMEDDLIQLTEALNLAKALNITETPYAQLAGIELKVVDDRQYLLGTRVITEEIKSLESRKDKPLTAFVPELREMEYWQTLMENDLARLQTSKANVRAFDLASPATSSLDPVKPNKLLIFLAAVMISGIIGVVIVFISMGIKSYQSREVIAQ